LKGGKPEGKLALREERKKTVTSSRGGHRDREKGYLVINNEGKENNGRKKERGD